jgi:isopenicillin-N N-acyltransferase-like protein
MTAAIRTIEISGDAHERGRQHGEAARDEIARSIEYYGRSFERTAKLTWSDITKLSPRWVPMIERYSPGILDEVRGIAEGANVTFEEILALNGRGELSSGNPFLDGEYEDCSSYAVLPEAAGDGHMYTGQNWDWRKETVDTVVLLRIRQPGKPTIVMQTEAGQVGRHGANSAGIGLNANGLGVRFGKGVGIPQPYIRRRILDSWDMTGALRAIFDSQQSICTNLLVSHKDGFAIDVETTPARHGWMYPTDGVLVHTNHFIAFVPEQVVETWRPFSVNSLWRLPRIQNVLKRSRTTHTTAEMRALIAEAMRDHFSFPNSVCRHHDDRDDAVDRFQTVMSSIVDLTTGEYLVAPGTPCTSQYEPIPWNLYDEATVPPGGTQAPVPVAG